MLLEEKGVTDVCRKEKSERKKVSLKNEIIEEGVSTEGARFHCRRRNVCGGWRKH